MALAKTVVDITELHPSGNGIGHDPRWGHIYVPFAFPGERIEVEIKHEIRSGKWNAARANMPAGHCTHAGQCGGCLWPGAPYAAQLEWKKKLLMRALRGVPQIASLSAKIHAAPATSGFRNRIHLHANFYQGRLEFGFYARGKRELVPVSDCPVAEDPLRDVVQSLALQRQGGWPPENFGFGIEIMHLPEEISKLVMVLYASPERQASLRTALPRFAALHRNLLVREAFAGDDDLFVWQRLPGITMYTKPGVFQQGNRRQSDTIRQLIAAEIAAMRPRTLFDLYSGSGNYSLPHYAGVGSIFGCDDNELGIAMALTNIERNAITNAKYVAGDAGTVLSQRRTYGWPDSADFVIIDPARYGMSSLLIEELGRLRPAKIFYISNHTQSFVRDARSLLATGFHPERLELVDFFPFTPQLNIVSIWRNSV